MADIADPWTHPIWTVAWMTWTDVFATYYPPKPELWMHPADWEAAGRPGEWTDMPVRRSLGIPQGTVRIFDRETLRYLPVIQPAP